MRVIFFIKLLIIFAASSLSLFAQQDKWINPDFYNCWVREEVLNNIRNGTIYESFHISDIKEIFLNSSSNEAFMGNYHEGWTQNYKVSDSSCINILGYNNETEYSASLVYNSNTAPVLILKSDTSATRFLPLDKKYNKIRGGSEYINDLFFTGEYAEVNDTSHKVIFNTDGTMYGLSSYNNYWVITDGFMIPGYFNTVLLRDTINHFNNVFLHWEKSGKYLYLYELTKDTHPDMGPEIYANSKIQCSYIELKRIK